MILMPDGGVRPDGWVDRYLNTSPMFPEIPSPAPGCRAFMSSSRKLGVIVSGQTEQDDKRWIHVSVSHRDRLPNWEELVLVRDQFLGKEARCLHLVSKASQHVNIHPYCMHIWHCVDGDGLPDFTWGSGMI